MTFDIDFVNEACSSIAGELIRDAVPVSHLLLATRDAIPFARGMAQFFPGVEIATRLLDVPATACCLIIETTCSPGSALPRLARTSRERAFNAVTAAIIMHEDALHVPDYHALTVSRDVSPRFPWDDDT